MRKETRACASGGGFYVDGQSMRKSAELAGVGISSASLYLNELEAATGKAIIRGKWRVVKGVEKSTRERVRQERKNGLLAASVRDFYSFRTTFVTLALMRGMPIDTVRKITGHQTVDVVTKHYFRPEREALKTAMQKTLPGLLTSSAEPFTPAEWLFNLLDSLEPFERWARHRLLLGSGLQIAGERYTSSIHRGINDPVPKCPGG